jgi:peptidoglycan/xylan/chitin deacetylase (PgdA/CDA1 family)
MRFPGLNRTRRFARRLRNRCYPGGLVLLYHRVTALRSDPQLLCVSPERFAEHMEILRHSWRPLSLADLVEATGERRLPARSVAVTFDDGYADNLHEARPALARSGVPATVFVVGAAVGSDREFYWDEVERLLLLPPRVPPVLRLNMPDGPRAWELGEGALRPIDDEKWRTWDVLAAHDPSSRHGIYRDLCRELMGSSADAREVVLEQLRCWSGEAPQGRPSHRTLREDELVTLADGGLVEIGAHTMHHPRLAELTPEQQSEEIRGGRNRLESILGRPPRGFSYPYGGRADYNRDSIRLVRDAGFAFACSNFGGPVANREDVFQVRRVIVRDWNGEEFKARMEEALLD